MKRFLFTGIALLFFAARLSGQLEDANAETKAKCERYLQTPLPAEASQTSVPRAWPDCDSLKLYSGIGVKADYAAARKCAWAERLAIQADIEPRFTTASIFGGSAMLSVLYANGEGVERNIPLAIRFACEQGWAPAEFEGRIAHLESMQDKPPAPGNKFRFCDDITSGAMDGFCASYYSEIADQKREDTIRSISSRWLVNQQDAFRALVQAKENYVEAHGRGETDLSGTMRGAREIRVEQRMRDKFLDALEAFEAGHLPKGSAGDFRRADADLNLLYRKAVASANAHEGDYSGAIQTEGIRNAQRAWLVYRDAWVAFAKLHYPSTDSNAWLTLLTKNRAASLRMTLCGIDSKDSECPQR
jgi:uncharacterized protein YecT (DUF1311 family)